ncbi:MAG TPA: monovalent cation/H+ antiporter complex subunit F [Kiritimatiellia bacterium]|jgi:multicomponent Na+:H+ antiporter subunit F|nr:cation:proton antiporter [Kiritimatiellia bacterium]OQC59305.1 MAG: Na(+)/H(+) antiporter subunit F [Verrucomicrobia bacterium ADurb.Bin018]MBP9572850.1 cation:proton antiporter [Kiritimatiellia bacterium]HOE00666.1 monovalent cation/H+ antiporter complex subunit F [Kiritimatiellia bacterium]HOE36251.1 monovalent cation/H+ antiporter complex subunit F [Kiritimatiellia bacterium]
MSIWMFTVSVLCALMLLAMVRLVRGPTAADRVVALDAINTLVVASMIVLGVAFKQIIFIDVAIIYALLSYVGTLFIAKYLGGEL